MTRGCHKADLTDQMFGRLRVIRFDRRTTTPAGHYLNYWLCQCDCGNQRSVLNKSLIKGAIRSCGCLRKEISAAKCMAHGKSHVSEYLVWLNMRRRCNDPKDKSYKDYGARGIKVCDRWTNFGNFYADMGSRPTPKHSIDRKNNDGDYNLANCRWATNYEQSLNKRNSILVPYNGAEIPLVEYCKITGLSIHTAMWRRLVLKLPLDKIGLLTNGRTSRR